MVKPVVSSNTLGTVLTPFGSPIMFKWLDVHGPTPAVVKRAAPSNWETRTAEFVVKSFHGPFIVADKFTPLMRPLPYWVYPKKVMSHAALCSVLRSQKS